VQKESQPHILKIKKSLEPTGVCKEDTKPTITQHYVDGAKLVDRFNALLAVLKWPYITQKKELVWFIHIVIMTVVNTWCLWNDIQTNYSTDHDEDGLKAWLPELINSLLQ
jgi:hypothetical protein